MLQVFSNAWFKGNQMPTNEKGPPPLITEDQLQRAVQRSEDALKRYEADMLTKVPVLLRTAKPNGETNK